VDSLNVGVAAGVLMEAFLREPAASSNKLVDLKSSKAKNKPPIDQSENPALQIGDLGF